MPHDKKGTEVKVGQVVMMLFKVTAVMTGEEHCNINLESVEPLYPTNHPTLLSSVNTKQVVVVKYEDEEEPKKSRKGKKP